MRKPFCYNEELDARPCIYQCDDCRRTDARFETLRRLRWIIVVGAFVLLAIVLMFSGDGR